MLRSRNVSSVCMQLTIVNRVKITLYLWGKQILNLTLFEDRHILLLGRRVFAAIYFYVVLKCNKYTSSFVFALLDIFSTVSCCSYTLFIVERKIVDWTNPEGLIEKDLGGGVGRWAYCSATLLRLFLQ